MESGKLITVIKGLKAKQFRVSRVLQTTVGYWLGFFLLIHAVFQKVKKRPFISFSNILQAALFLGVFSYCGLI